jgi:hypothetical protein
MPTLTIVAAEAALAIPKAAIKVMPKMNFFARMREIFQQKCNAARNTAIP